MFTNMNYFLAFWLALLGIWACSPKVVSGAETGVTDSEILIGGVMDLEGRSAGLGLGMKAGIEAAFRGEKVGKRSLRFITLNDSYNPSKTATATRQLLEQGVLLFAGNVGTPTAKVSLPILAEGGVPAVGFFTGAGLLRPGAGNIINYRASYVQETKSVIDKALLEGIRPQESVPMCKTIPTEWRA